MTRTYPDDSKPFPEVVGVAISHFHPEVRNSRDIEDLQQTAREDPPSEWIREIKGQFTHALEQHLEGMDLEEFDREVVPNARTYEIFVRRMWASIFPDDPIPGEPSEPWDATYTLIDIYLGDRDPDENLVHPERLRRHFQRLESEQTPLLRAMKHELARMLQGDFEGLDMREFRSEASPYYWHLREDDKDFARHAWSYLFPDEPSPES